MPSLAIVAWYGFLFVAGQWGLVGPYDSREECTSVMEWLETQGLETESCEQIVTDVEARLLAVGERPN